MGKEDSYEYLVRCKRITLRKDLPSEFSEFSWHILRHIFLPQNNKKDRKIDPSLRQRRIIRENNRARNKSFQLPLIPTTNQILWHCSNSQSPLRSKSGRSENYLVSLYQVQLLAAAFRESVWELQKLGLISGYLVRIVSLVYAKGSGVWAVIPTQKFLKYRKIPKISPSIYKPSKYKPPKLVIGQKTLR